MSSYSQLLALADPIMPAWLHDGWTVFPAKQPGMAVRARIDRGRIERFLEPLPNDPRLGQAATAAPGGSDSSPSPPPSAPGHTPTPTDAAMDQQIVKAIQLDVIGKRGDGKVEVFSEFHQEFHVIDITKRLDYAYLLMICGKPAKDKVVCGSGEVPGMYTVSDVRNAIAYLAGFDNAGEKLGVGCWCLPSNGNGNGEIIPTASGQPDAVVLVGHKEGAEWNGSGRLVRLTDPRHHGFRLDFDPTAKPWYQFDRLAGYLDNCTQEFAQQTMDDAVNFFGKWTWRNQEESKFVLAGLLFATWVQSAWSWRPQVATIGASNSGKTTLFNALDRIFANICIKSSGSTAAGIRQATKTSSRIILCDEFEDSRYREEVLEMLRASGRGDIILRGTTNQKGQGYGLRHIAWVAAIEAGLKREPDKNRFIILDLEKPAESEMGKLVLPPDSWLVDLGQRTLAVAIKHVNAARLIFDKIKDFRAEGIDARIVESFSVPAAMLSAICGKGPEYAKETLVEMLRCVDTSIGKSSDEADLMRAIIASQVHTGRENLAVGQLMDIVQGPMRFDPKTETDYRHTCEQSMARVGLKFGEYSKDKDTPPSLRGQPCLVVAYEVVSRHLLSQGRWGLQSIDQILKRMPGTIRSRLRVGGQRHPVLLMDKVYLDEHFFSDDAHVENNADQSGEKNSSSSSRVESDNGHPGF